MFLFVIGLIFALVFVIVLITFVVSKDEEVKGGSAVVGGIGFLVAALLIFFSCVTTVGTKNVAVTTTFGRPTGHLSNGFHLKAPWEKTTELNDALQTDTYASDNGSNTKQGGATDTCIHVRIDRQATACVNTSIRWKIRPSGVDYLFRNFKDNETITDNVVLRDLQNALNSQFLTYDPLGINAAGHNTNPPLTIFAKRVKDELVGTNGHSGQMGQYIDVQSVIIPIINYDSETQSKVNQLLQQIAATRVAQQSEQTALAQAKANEALSKSVSNDPGVLTSKCLDIVQKSLEDNRSLPAGFNCFGGTTGISVQSGK